MSSQVFEPEKSPIAGTMLLEASAGTGKTYALERMVSRLIGRKHDPLSIDQILVVTFSNKAAREMRERIRKILKQRSREESRDELERLKYQSALTAFDSAAIYTIHSFCLMVLSTWPFESSSPFQQDLVSSHKLETEETYSWLASREISTIDKRVLEAAFRQSGSSEKLVEKIVRLLINENIPPDSLILPTDDDIDRFHSFLTDSENPGGHLCRAADRLFSPSWSIEAVRDLFLVSVGTKKRSDSLEKICRHLAACRSLRGIPSLTDEIFGDPSNSGIGGHFQSLLYAVYSLNVIPASLNPETRKLLDAVKDLITALQPYIDFRPKNAVINLIDRYMQCLFYNQARKRLEQRIEARKNESGIWSYADLIRRVNKAVNDGESPLKNLLGKRYKAALIDEFQDTDPQQWKLFKTIFDAPEHILALIGDPKQSIYGFRGTGLQGYYAAQSVVPEKNRYCLDTNYRSRSALVAGVNRLFEPIFQTRSDGGQPVGFQPAASGFQNREELDWSNADRPIALLKAEGENQIAEGIVQEIRAILDPVTGARWLSEDRSREVSASEIAVLVRTVRQEEDIYNRLTALGVPAVRFRTQSVLTQSIAQTLKELLEAIENPRNQSLWRGVLLGEFHRLPPDLLISFEKAGYLDLFSEKGMEWRSAFLLGRATEALEDFFSFTKNLGIWAGKINRKDVEEKLSRPWNRRVLSEPDGERKWQDWRQLCELIQQKQFEGLRDIPGIIAWMNLNSSDAYLENRESAIRLATEKPAVRILTMHGAKGLEFPLVFLHGGYTAKTRRNSHSPWRFDDNGTLVIDHICREKNFNCHRAYAWEEDKRLWYVAFTRAAYKLWVPLPSGNDHVVQLDSFWNIADGLDETLPDEDGIRLPAHEQDVEDVSEFKEKLLSRIQNLAADSKCMHIFEPAHSSLTVLSQPGVKPGRRAPLPSSDIGKRDPANSSYTSLTSQVEDRADRTAPKKRMDSSEASWRAVYGTMVHACLEQCDFSLAENPDESAWMKNPDIESLFADQAGRCFSWNWYKEDGNDLKLKTLVRNTLRTPIPVLGPLYNLKASCYRREAEFQMFIPGDSSITDDDLEMRIDRGFLKGFIDLLVNKDGLWWVVDWKTNMTESGQSIAELMDSHHYHLQYELYLLGLCRALAGRSKRPVIWEKEIGGAVYLFLRSISEYKTDGIFQNKPSLKRMLSIAESMGCTGIIE